MTHTHWRREKRDADDKANARLIAEAPAMLDALREVAETMALLEDGGNEEYDALPSPLRDKLDLLIARIEDA